MVITIDATKDVNKVYESTWEKLNTGKILKHWLKKSILLIDKSNIKYYDDGIKIYFFIFSINLFYFFIK